MRIGVLTGGGDVPGLNVCIKAIVKSAADLGWQVVGFRRGWSGPLNSNPDTDAPQGEWIQALSEEDVRAIDREGGTFLHTSRTNPGKVRPDGVPGFLAGRFPIDEARGLVDCTPHILSLLERLRIDAILPIGGDDTLSYAARLSSEGVPVVAIPKTMDNDVFGTDYCIGFSTAVTRSIDSIHALRTTTGSHERIAVVELFGRNSGETALLSGYLSDADRVVISEVPCEAEKLADMLMQDRSANPSRYAMLVVSEGARLIGGDVIERGEADAYGHRKLGGIGQILGERLKELTGVGIVGQQLAYLMRSGPPDSLDRMVAASFGHMAVQQAEARQFGVMVAMQDGNYTTVPVDSCLSGPKHVDVDAFYDTENYRPKVPDMTGKPMFLY